MREFFRSKIFIVLCIVALLLMGMAVMDTAAHGKMTFFENIAGTLITPLQNFCTTVIRYGGNLVEAYTQYDSLKEENEKLKSELPVPAS